MNDRRVPGASIAEGRRRPVMLSSVAEGDFANLKESAKRPLIAGLQRLAAGSLEGETLVQGPLGEQGYKYFVAGNWRAVYREMSPDELINQGYEERLARKGGIFVVDILPTPTKDHRVPGAQTHEYVWVCPRDNTIRIRGTRSPECPKHKGEMMVPFNDAAR